MLPGMTRMPRVSLLVWSLLVCSPGVAASIARVDLPHAAVDASTDPAGATGQQFQQQQQQQQLLLLELAQLELQRYTILAAGVGPATDELRLALVDLGVRSGADGATLRRCGGDVARAAQQQPLAPQEHAIWRCSPGAAAGAAGPSTSHHFVLAGGDAAGLLFAAYSFAEAVLGVHFSVAGDRLPHPRPLAAILLQWQTQEQLDVLQRVRSPRFQRRGLQPFHDFREGPDWWSESTYAEILSNMVKLRGNFIGLHTYSYSGLTNWIGPPSAVLPNGTVTASASTGHWATAGGGQHFVGNETKPFPTSTYLFGASALFDQDCFCGNAEVVTPEVCPLATSPAATNAAFDRAGEFQARVFGIARSLGVTTATGVELPVVASGWPNKTAQEIYSGTLLRLQRLRTPLDFFWLWTSENWEWSQVNVSSPLVVQALLEFQALRDANHELGAPFKLATAGWTLGPLGLDSWSGANGGLPPAAGGNSSTIPLAGDRVLWDEHLAPEYHAFSAIDGHVGAFPPNPSFGKLDHSRREGWTIPWLEDDPGITSMELWAGRVLRHASEAVALGATGLFGIHWRTRTLSPQIAALFQAGWSDTAPADVDSFYTAWCAAEFGSGLRGNDSGGEGAESDRQRREDALVQQACAPFRRLDKQECSGNCKGLEHYPSGCGDPGIANVFATPDCLRPVAWGSTIGIVPNDTAFPRNVGYTPGNTGQGSPVPDPAQCAVDGLYDHWVDAFTGLGSELQTHGPAVVERWQYWDGQFRAMRAQARVNCAWAKQKAAFATLRRLTAAAAKAPEPHDSGIPATATSPHLQHGSRTDADRSSSSERRGSAELSWTQAVDTALFTWIDLVQTTGAMFTALLESTTNAGEMGIVADLQDSKLPAILNATDRALLASALLRRKTDGGGGGGRLPAVAVPSTSYAGRPRLFVPALPPFVERGQALAIRAILLSNATTAATTVTLQWRELSSSTTEPWHALPMTLQRAMPGAGGVWEGSIPPSSYPRNCTMFEWAVESAAPTAGVAPYRFPATAPTRGQSVIVRTAVGTVALAARDGPTA